MKDISIYFQQLERSESFPLESVGQKIEIFEKDNFPELQKGGVAVFYVPEHRGDKQIDHDLPAEKFRTQFYNLNLGFEWNLPLYDLGNILPGKEKKDTFFAVSQVITELIKAKIIPVIIGGSQDLTVAQYRGYSSLEQMVNICCVDHKLDLGSPDVPMHAHGYLSELLLERPCFLFNLANIGLQAPYAPKSELDLFEKLYFDVCRLGEFNADFKKAEPHLRNADILSLDVKSIKASELINLDYTSPNGFYAEQICQITRYAGISDKLTSFGIYNYYPEKISGTLSSLIAQMIWYFIDGVVQRKGDFPVGTKKDYTKFSVHMEGLMDELVFYRSNKSDRWWMEVPYPPKEGSKWERHHMVPCDAADYQLAMKSEIPDLWWRTYQKLT